MSKNAVMPLEDYIAACDTIREKTATTDTIKSGSLAKKIDNVFDAGKKSEYDRFWDAFQENGMRDDYRCAFMWKWNDEAFQPKYDIMLNQKLGQYNSQQAFELCEVQDIASCLAKNNVTIDTSQAERLDSNFRQAKTISLPPFDLSNCKEMAMTFYNMEKLKSLELNNLRENCTFDRPANYCFALENVKITGTIGNSGLNFQYSPLTHDSLVNIIDCLKDFRETTVTQQLNTQEVSTITMGSLVVGQEYTWSYYVSSRNGWLDGKGGISDTEVKITTVADYEIIDGNPYPALKSESDILTVIIYQDAIDILIRRDGYANDGDIVKLTLKEETPTQNCTIVLGSGNLAKLTDGEKAIATEKGWELA